MEPGEDRGSVRESSVSEIVDADLHSQRAISEIENALAFVGEEWGGETFGGWISDIKTRAGNANAKNAGTDPSARAGAAEGRS